MTCQNFLLCTAAKMGFPLGPSFMLHFSRATIHLKAVVSHAAAVS